MARIDRRSKLALDESYRYYRHLEKGEEPRLFELTRSLCTLSHALYFAETGEFKLTRQLWRRLQQALFDRLISSFSGRFNLLDSEGTVIDFGREIPEGGYLSFRAAGCKRIEDTTHIEISRLYPKTFHVISKVWKEGRRKISPRDFEGIPDCDEHSGVCMMKPIVVGHETLHQESRTGKQEAYHKWWELYWQAYCTPNRNERTVLYKHMLEIETVWGNLYY